METENASVQAHSAQIGAVSANPSQQAAGLASAEAAARLEQYGRNDPAPAKRYSAVADLLRLFLNPLVVILLIAAVSSFFLGDVTGAEIILTIVVLSNTLDFMHTRKSRIAIEELQERVAPTATVMRDGERKEIPRTEVVPGDIVLLSAGDLTPADARLLESRDLYIQQAALTGESLPVEKRASGAEASTRPDAENMVFLGTSVVSGTATAIVVATGSRTSFGDIAARLSARSEPTSFDRGLRDFSLLMTRAVLFLVAILVIFGVFAHRDPFQSLLFAVALAVGLTPEFLPMIVAVTLSNGARAMARKKVIVKHLSAIQNFGSIDILCSDKTGTLTSGMMALDRCVGPFGDPSRHAMLLARLNSRFETGIRSPLDAAILQLPEMREEAEYEKRDEIPYDFERRRLSIVVERGPRRLLITKGAPEGIMERSNRFESGLESGFDAECRVLPLDSASRMRCSDTFRELSEQGFRVLAVAYAEVPVWDQYSPRDEADLTLAGFLAFSDPVLADARESLTALQSQGVQVKIITGDSELVTAQVCRLAGLGASRIVRGDEIDRMTDGALAHVVQNANVFARVSPAQKSRILLALKHTGHVVGFMGDGINDAPSLHAADVGISVSSAVDVAREAADIVLLEPGLNVLSSGIIEGRKAFGNVMKYLMMGTSSNFGNMFSMAGASLFLPFLPMLPTQILLNNFMYDLSQVTIPTDSVDDEFLRKPREWDIGLIRKFMVVIGPISSIFDFLTFYVLLHFFHATQALFHTGWFVESLATQTLVIFVIRTSQNPFRSRPSHPLALTTIGIVCAGALLPFTRAAGPLGFLPLNGAYFGYLAAATAIYLILVEIGKRALLRR
jgi:Mg2+-importing ATPase